jgi:hypothetical protein
MRQRRTLTNTRTSAKANRTSSMATYSGPGAPTKSHQSPVTPAIASKIMLPVNQMGKSARALSPDNHLCNQLPSSAVDAIIGSGAECTCGSSSFLSAFNAVSDKMVALFIANHLFE